MMADGQHGGGEEKRDRRHAWGRAQGTGMPVPEDLASGAAPCKTLEQRSCPATMQWKRRCCRGEYDVHLYSMEETWTGLNK